MGQSLSAVIPHDIMLSSDDAYFFRGDEYIRYDVAGKHADAGYPRKIADDWPGVWPDGFDAAVVWPNGKIYFFRGHEYIRWDVLKDAVDKGYPKPISASWPGIWPDGIDAAVVWDKGQAYFFRGSEYIRFNVEKHRPDPGYPKPIAGNWDGLWEDGVDAAVVLDNGKGYFFKDDKYLRYRVADKKLETKHPAPIHKYWHGIWDLEHFTYRAKGVPDTDQKWSTLPGGGANHCVPTSSYNWLRFLHDNGVPGAIHHGGESADLAAQLNIFELGKYMKTSSTKGTGYADGIDGLQNWFDDADIDAVVTGYCFTEGEDIDFPRLQDVTTRGYLTNICFGRWVKKSGDWARKGGHCMTLVQLAQNGSQFIVTAHNPIVATGDSDTTQSPVSDDPFEVTHVSGVFGKYYATLLHLDKATKPFRLIDTLITCAPTVAASVWQGKLSWAASRSEQDLNGPKRPFVWPSGLVALPFPGEPNDIAIDLSDAHLIAVADPGSGRIWRFDTHTQRWSILAELAEPARRLTYGGRDFSRLFAAGRSQVTELERKTGRQLSRKVLPFEVHALTWDQHTRSLFAASDADRKLVRLGDKLKVLARHELVAPHGKGRLNLTADRRTGTITASRVGTDQLATLRVRPSGAITTGLAALSTRHGASAVQSRHGGLLGVEAGKVVRFSQDGDVVARDVFPDLRAGSLLKVSRSWHNLPYDDDAWRS